MDLGIELMPVCPQNPCPHRSIIPPLYREISKINLTKMADCPSRLMNCVFHIPPYPVSFNNLLCNLFGLYWIYHMDVSSFIQLVPIRWTFRLLLIFQYCINATVNHLGGTFSHTSLITSQGTFLKLLDQRDCVFLVFNTYYQIVLQKSRPNVQSHSNAWIPVSPLCPILPLPQWLWVIS